MKSKTNKRIKQKLSPDPAFVAYSTILYVEASVVDEKTSKMTIKAETPVTTITSLADFGRTRDRLGQFVDTLAKELDKTKSAAKPE